jgi:hypothetical protein
MSDEEFDFDDYEPEDYEDGIGADEYEEPSLFPDHERVEEDEEEAEAKYERNLIKALIKREPDEWLVFLVIHRSTLLKKEWSDITYDQESYQKLKTRYEWIKPCHSVYGSTLGRLGKAVSTMTSNCVFTNDEGRAYSAMQGDAEFSDTKWIVEHVNPKRNVMPIKAQHAVDLQLFCASVSLENEQTTQLIDSRIQNVNLGKLVQRNVPPEEDDKKHIPAEIKALFPCLIANFKGTPMLDPKTKQPILDAKGKPRYNKITPKQLEQRAFIWKRVWRATNKIVLPTSNLPLELAFFCFVKKSFGYEPKPVKWREVLYNPYPCIDKDMLKQLSSHSHWHGGVWLNKYHYLNEALREVPMFMRLIGGEVPLDWISYNTQPLVCWERAKAGIESNDNLLGTTTRTVRQVHLFNGIFYDPVRIPVEKCSNFSGVIIPYDSAKNGLAWLERWRVEHVQKKKNWIYKTWVSFGPAPCLWVITIDPNEKFSTPVKDGTPPSGYNDEQGIPWYHDNTEWGAMNSVMNSYFWKSMPAMILYNFVASLNQNWALSKVNGNRSKVAKVYKDMEKRGYPADPISYIKYLPGAHPAQHTFKIPVRGKIIEKILDVPEVQPVHFAPDYLPGRWFVKQVNHEAPKKHDETVDRWADLANVLYAADSGFTPGRKASKFEEDADASTKTHGDPDGDTEPVMSDVDDDDPQYDGDQME